MAKDKNKEPIFDLCGGHPALDFVNSLDHRFREDGPKELLPSYGDLLRFSSQTGLIEPARVRQLANVVDSGAAPRALRAARELREAMASLFYARLDGNTPVAEAVSTLERNLHDADRHKRLRWITKNGKESSGLEWDWDRSGVDLDLPLWMLAQAAIELLTSAEMDRVSACSAESCRWLFLDTSKNHTRRWCNMKICGNRMKARRFQARHAA